MRTIKIRINQFPTTPHSLKSSDSTGLVDSIKISLKSLFHHYYLSKYGNNGRNKECYEYKDQLTDGEDWRFRGAGIGIDKEAKRNVSNELGKAFARWFHYTHLGMTYFAPLENFIDKKNSDGSQWIRNSKGDIPDYICGIDESDVNLLEAKGRYCSVSFGNAEFDEFRQQIQRVSLQDGKGSLIQVKGFISAARWATEDTPRTESTLFVEDPFTEGEPVGELGFPITIGRSMTMGHYESIFRRLQLPMHADAIRHNWRIPVGTSRRGVWECITGPLRGKRFVGGLIFDESLPMSKYFYDEDYYWRFRNQTNNPFILNPPHQFFGVDFDTLQRIVSNINIDANYEEVIRIVEVPQELESLSLLRDGTILGPSDYFRPIDVIEI